jgi:hypothetical protein
LSAKVQDVVSRLARIVLGNLDVTAKSDEARKQELKANGKIIGAGQPHGRNDCLTDSLIQVLAASGRLPSFLERDVSERQKVCNEVRLFLAGHEDHRVHPRWRTETGEIAQDRDDHKLAYLQHEIHAELIIRFVCSGMFLGFRGVPKIILCVFSRWDSEQLPPSTMSFGGDADTSESTEEICLYNCTGRGFTGVHYEPLLPSQSSAAGEATSPLKEVRCVIVFCVLSLFSFK